MASMTYEQMKQACLTRMVERGWYDGEDFFGWLLPVEFKDRYETELAESDDLYIRVMSVIG